MPILSIDDLRTAAKRRLPQAVFDYIDGGSTDEKTLRANRDAFDRLSLKPVALTDISTRSQATTVLGQPVSSPIILAPIGLAGLAARRGEVSAARAAQREKIATCLSTAAISSIEEVSAAVGGDFWYQLYVMRDRDLTRRMIERARAAGCGALVLAVDVAIQGPRERDARNGLAIPPRVTRRNALSMVRRIPWIMDVLMGPKITFGNFAEALEGKDIVAGARFVAQQFDPSVTWKDVEWFKSVWGGKIVLKGVLNPEDVRRAADHGIDAVVISNHGGRQLDGASASLTALPAAVEAADGRLEVLFDGGIRRGGDVVKALALGAKACLIGRAYMYGLGAAGEPGVAQAIQILKREIDTALGLLGLTDIAQVNESILIHRAPAEFDAAVAARLRAG